MAEGTTRVHRTAKTINVRVTENALAEGDRTVGLTLSGPTVVDDDPADSGANTADSSEFFVRQHYHDFLSRDPAAAQRRVRRAEMVRAFIIPDEYRKRFGPN